MRLWRLDKRHTVCHGFSVTRYHEDPLWGTIRLTVGDQTFFCNQSYFGVVREAEAVPAQAVIASEFAPAFFLTQFRAD